MTKNTKKTEVLGMDASQLLTGLEQELSTLINDQNSGLSDLSKFSKNLTKKSQGIKLTKNNLNMIKEDLKNGGLIDFEGGNRNGIQFGFEVIGNDISPTLTPNGDCIIPVNFRYNSQRRTKLLVLHIEDENGQNMYSIPDGENEYPIEIGNEKWMYCLQKDDKGFHFMMK